MNRLDLVVGPNGAAANRRSSNSRSHRCFRKRFRQRRRDSQTTLACRPGCACLRGPPRSRPDTRAKLIELRRALSPKRCFLTRPNSELIDSAHAASYTVILHVLLIPEELAVQRVRHRVKAGGHDVPEDTDSSTVPTSLATVATRSRAATPRPSSTTCAQRSRIVAQMSAGQLVGAPMWPAWARRC